MNATVNVHVWAIALTAIVSGAATAAVTRWLSR